MEYNRNNSRDNESMSQKRKINFDGDEFELGDKIREESKLEQFFNIDPKAVFSNEAMAAEFESIRRYALSNDGGGLNNFGLSDFSLDVGSTQNKKESSFENGGFKTNDDKKFAIANDFILNRNENMKMKETDIYGQRPGMVRPEYFGRPNTPGISNLSRREQDIVLNARNIHNVKENNFISNGYNAPLPLFQRHPPIYGHEMPFNRNIEMHKYNQQHNSSMHYMHKQKTNINPTVFMHREKFIENSHRGNSIPNEFYNRYRKDIPRNIHSSNFSRFPPLITNPYLGNPLNVFPPNNLKHKNCPPPPYPNTPYPQTSRINSPRHTPFIPIPPHNTPITHINPKLIIPSTSKETTPTPLIYTKTLKPSFNKRPIDLPNKDHLKHRQVNTPLTPPAIISPPLNFLSTFPPSFVKFLKIRKVFLSKLNIPRSFEKISSKDFLFYLKLINSLLSIQMYLTSEEQQILCRLFFISITHNGFAVTEKNFISLFIEITGKQFVYFKELYLFFVYPLEQIFFKTPVICIAERDIIDKRGVIIQRMKYSFSYFKLTPLNVSMGLKYGNSIDIVWILNVIKNTELSKNLFEDVLSIYYEISSYIGSYKLGSSVEVEGVSNKECRLEGVSNKDSRLEGVNDKDSRLEGVSNKGLRLEGVSNALHTLNANTQHPVNNCINGKRFKCIKDNTDDNISAYLYNGCRDKGVKDLTNNITLQSYNKGVKDCNITPVSAIIPYHRLSSLSLINLILLREQCLDIILDSLDTYFNDSLKYLKHFILSPSSLHRFIDSIFTVNKICNTKIKEYNRYKGDRIEDGSIEGVNDKGCKLEGVNYKNYTLKGVNFTTDSNATTNVPLLSLNYSSYVYDDLRRVLSIIERVPYAVTIEGVLFERIFKRIKSNNNNSKGSDTFICFTHEDLNILSVIFRMSISKNKKRKILKYWRISILKCLNRFKSFLSSNYELLEDGGVFEIVIRFVCNLKGFKCLLENILYLVLNYRVGNISGGVRCSVGDIKDIRGVSDMTGLRDIRGVNNMSYEQQGFNNITYKQQGVTNMPYEQQGVNNITNKQQGVNKLPYEQQGINHHTYNNKDNFNSNTNTPIITYYNNTFNIHNRKPSDLFNIFKILMKNVFSKEGVSEERCNILLKGLSIPGYSDIINKFI